MKTIVYVLLWAAVCGLIEGASRGVLDIGFAAGFGTAIIVLHRERAFAALVLGGSR